MFTGLLIFITLCLAIVQVVKISDLSSELRALKSTLQHLIQQQDTLQNMLNEQRHDLTQYLYGDKPGASPFGYQQGIVEVMPPSVPVPAQAYAPASTYAPVATSAYVPAPTAAPVDVSPPLTQPVATATQPAFPTTPPTQPTPDGAYSPPPTTTTPKKPARSLENLFGQNIIGIIASVLVFIGLIFLGYLVVPYLNDIMKIIAMFVLSTALTAFGYTTNSRFTNNFTKALLGTGIGAYFISIELTHLYFGAINDIAAAIFISAWIAAALFIAKQSESLLVAIIAHVGMVFSICSGYALGMSDNRVLMLLGYQLVSTAVIIVGNLFWTKKLYRFGLFVTLALTIYASGCMWANLSGPGVSFTFALPIWLLSGAFIVQFLAGSFIVYLIFVSIVRVRDGSVLDTTGSASTRRMVMQTANIMLWFISLLLNVFTLVYKLHFPTQQAVTWVPADAYHALLVATVGTLVLLYATALALITLRRKIGYVEDVEIVSVVSLIVGSCLLLFWLNFNRSAYLVQTPHIPYLVIPILFAVAAKALTGSRQYHWLANIILIIDAFEMIFGGYSELTAFMNKFLAMAYLALLLVLACAIWFLIDTRVREQYKQTYRLTVVFMVQASLASMLLFDGSRYDFSVFALVNFAGLLIMHLLKEDIPLEVFRVDESAVLLYLCLINYARSYTINGNGLEASIRVVAGLLALVIILDRIRIMAHDNSVTLRTPGVAMPSRDVEVVSAVSIHILILSTILGLTTWLSRAYVLSLVSMIIALALVALGFWSRIRSLRLYGLVIVILCVLKLTLFDIGGLNTIMRVIAFIGGGVICFGISALYNFAVKLFRTGTNHDLNNDR